MNTPWTYSVLTSGRERTLLSEVSTPSAGEDAAPVPPVASASLDVA